MSRKIRIKVGIVIVITCVMCFSGWSFAAEDPNKIGTIAWTLNFITSVLSWLWIIFANLAGKFLTNNWVYGQQIGIDILLWQYRNIVKNMANFCLGFYLLYVIFKGLIGQFKGNEDGFKNLKSVLLRVLIAGVGVQASRFLTSVVLDVSSITLSAVGAFPSQIISKSELVENGFRYSMREFTDGGSASVKAKILDLFPKNGAANSFMDITKIPLNNPLSNTGLVDNLMPNKDDISGPLYYMGVSILRTDKINSVAFNSESAVKKSILNLIINGGTTIVYAIEMGVLCVIALMRILYLWMFIVLSPFAILLTCIQKAGEKELMGKGFVSSLMKQINLKTFLAKAFQPAIIVLGISLCMIFVTLISGVVNKDNTRSMYAFDLGSGEITTYQDEKKTSESEKDATYTTRLDSNLLRISMTSVGKGLLDLIMAILTVVLVYFIIDMSIKIGNSIGGGKDWLSDKISKVQKGVEGLMTSVPIIPVAGYDKDGVAKTHYMSIGKGKGLIDAKIGQYGRKIEDKYSEQTNLIRSWLGENNTMMLGAEDKRRIENIVTDDTKGLRRLLVQQEQLLKLREGLEDKDKNKGYGMVLNSDTGDRWWQGRFRTWLTEMKDRRGEVTDSTWLSMIDWWNQGNNSVGEKALENLFKHDEVRYVKAYAKLFELGENIDTWQELKDIDISLKK